MAALWLCLLASGIALYPPSSHAEKQEKSQLIILLSKSARPYQKVAEIIVGQLEKNNPGVAVKVISLTAPFKADIPGDRKMVISVGISASRYALQHWSDSPLLMTLISRRTFLELTAGQVQQKQLSAVFIDQPLARQVRFLHHLLPAAKRTGILLGQSSRRLEPTLNKLFSALGITLVTRNTNERKLANDIRYLARQSDVILALPDHDIMTPNHAKWLLYMAYLRKTPVLGFSRSYVDAGALAAIYTTPAQNARHAARVASNFLTAIKTVGHHLAAPDYPADFTISINNSVARSLSMTLKSKEQIRNDLLADIPPSSAKAIAQ